ncbi:helix-turn-helix transcriptional regulator [Mesorhizobium sp. B1-1-8]|uniref:helix-turn-helix transcriptional regulator n=1 Tax=Mesorhizobium sp. B1-1-8 TaxID=2589976 RepID=UPI001D01B3BD|nr:helix-turn-helix transcriptional regulator [Mesorhizobium sp. B1-1-8]UCI10445.1 helix-turn-helix transcriptional regulator [Mesorhizobium sp. B1-1-8]
MNVHSPVSAAGFEVPYSMAKLGFCDAIGRASAAIGDETFYDRLLEVLSSLVDTDLLSLVRYSSFGAPDLIIPREIRSEVAAPYDSGLYALDPFHHYWREVGVPAVCSLRRLAPTDMWKSRYALEFLRAARISDEIAVFLPPIGGASPTLIVDRAEGEFAAAELDRIDNVFPLLAGLHSAHLKAIINHGLTADAAEKPLRLIDRSGKELAANNAWKRLAAHPVAGLAEALADLAKPGKTQVSLPDGRLVVRSPLGTDFGAAPGGLCDQVEVSTMHAPAGCSDGWLAGLTHRERQIVELTLEGHPIASIANRLGVKRGTIKNHRLRLYQKLDITTERELFLYYVQNLRAGGF